MKSYHGRFRLTGGMLSSAADRILPWLVACALFTSSAMALAQETASSINPAIARDAVMNILPPIPAELRLSAQDYVATNDASADTRYVQVRIGPEGQVMPTRDWQDSHPSHCRSQARETNTPDRILSFKLIRTQEVHEGLTRYQYYTYARILDAESDIIKRQVEVESSVGQASDGAGRLMENPDREVLDDAVSYAMQKLGVDLGMPDDGCGDIRLAHLSGSQVDEPFVFVAGYQNQSVPNMTYEWHFGDGSSTTSGEQLGQHVYAAKGDYTVTVHVSGEDVRAGSASIGITVKDEEPIQPRDGLWSITLNDIEMTGCAPKIADGVRTALSQQMAAGNTESLEFEEPFHPQPLMKHDASLVWKQTGLNSWQTVVADVQKSGMQQKVVLDAEVMSPTRIEEVGNHDIVMPDSMAKLLGGSAHCRATGYYELTWQGAASGG